jgi:hypothetical protein
VSSSSPLGDDLERMHVQLFRCARRHQRIFGFALRDDIGAHEVVEHTTQVEQPFRRDALFEWSFDRRHGIPVRRHALTS